MVAGAELNGLLRLMRPRSAPALLPAIWLATVPASASASGGASGSSPPWRCGTLAALPEELSARPQDDRASISLVVIPARLRPRIGPAVSAEVSRGVLDQFYPVERPVRPDALGSLTPLPGASPPLGRSSRRSSVHTSRMRNGHSGQSKSPLLRRARPHTSEGSRREPV